MKKWLSWTCLLLLLSAFACTAQAAVRTQENLVWYRIHFGMGVGTNAITPEVFSEFLTKYVSPRFPQGMTVTPGRGQWVSPDVGVIKERTVIVDVNGDNSDESRQKINEIAESYVKQFKRVKASIFVLSIPGVTSTLWY